MARRAYRQRSLVEVLLPDSDKLWDPALRRIDTLLEDDVLTDRIADALARRHPQSQRRTETVRSRIIQARSPEEPLFVLDPLRARA